MRIVTLRENEINPPMKSFLVLKCVPWGRDTLGVSKNMCHLFGDGRGVADRVVLFAKNMYTITNKKSQKGSFFKFML